MKRLSIFALTTFALGGCDVWWTDDCEPRYYDRTGAAEEPAQQIRNPQTGQCESYGPDPYYCDEECGPCPDYATGDVQALPSWAVCGGICEGLAESDCLGTVACRAIYVLVDGQTPTYAECWGTDQSGPIQGGECAGLDANTCSMHDDCVAIHVGTCADPGCAGNFSRCAAEPATTGEPGLCYAAVTCDQAPPDCPDNTTPGILDGCYTGYCIPFADCESAPACEEVAAETTCIARADCTPIYEGQNCSCSGGTCTCQSWLYTSCATD